MTDSTTAGYLQPTGSTPVSPSIPLMGQSLNRFFQQHIKGITGLPGTHVRVAFQTESPEPPSDGNCWCAFRVLNRKAEPFAFEGVVNDQYLISRHEEMDILCSFYDKGSNGYADYYASVLREGLHLSQNRQPLTLVNMGLIETGDIFPAPVILKQTWLYRMDITFRIRRQLVWTFDVKTITSASIDLQCEGPDGSMLVETVAVNAQP